MTPNAADPIEDAAFVRDWHARAKAAIGRGFDITSPRVQDYDEDGDGPLSVRGEDLPVIGAKGDV